MKFITKRFLESIDSWKVIYTKLQNAPYDIDALNNLSKEIFEIIRPYHDSSFTQKNFLLHFNRGSLLIRYTNSYSFWLYEAFFQTNGYAISTFYDNNIPVFTQL